LFKNSFITTFVSNVSSSENFALVVFVLDINLTAIYIHPRVKATQVGTKLWNTFCNPWLK